MTNESLINLIDSALPQKQCTKCGYNGCLSYSKAIVNEGVPINRCSPGGEQSINRLAKILNTDVLPLDENCGIDEILKFAVIDEEHCIGCTICTQACPVDAIIGTKNRRHTVLSDWCTGCGLCVEPCPVDCISMIPASHEWTDDDAKSARYHYQNRQNRISLKNNINSINLTNSKDLSENKISKNELNNLDKKNKLSLVNKIITRAKSRRNFD